MSTEEMKKDFPQSDADALISKVLEDVRAVRDPSILNACRSLFRSRIPFHLRSYAAAALVLRSLGAGIEGGGPGKRAPKGRTGRGAGDGRARRPPEGAGKPGFPPAVKGGASAPEPGLEGQRLKRGRYAGEGTTLFFSMGRRQRFTAQNILRVLSDVSGIEETDIGAIRTFDNYSFVNVDPAAADLIIQDVDGTLVKGRKLVVNRARPRKEEMKTGPEGGSPGEGPARSDPIE